MNFTFQINGENWQTIKTAFKRIVRKVSNFSPAQISQQNGMPHFVIFAESDNKKKTLYDLLEGFGHAFSLLTGGHSDEGDNRCFDCLNISRKKKKQIDEQEEAKGPRVIR
jgi:hypothetical protein